MDSRKNFGMEDFGQLLIAMNQELNVLCKNVGCLQDQVNALDSLVRDDVKVRLDVLEERLLVVEAHMAGRTEELEAELDEELKEDESFCEDKENGGEVQVNVERNFDVLDRLQEVEIGFIGQMDQMVASMEFESEADELGEAVKVSFLLFGSEVVEADDGLGKSGKYENKKFLLKNESVEGTSESLDKVGDCLGNDSEVKEKKTKASSKLKGVKGGFLDRVTDPTFAAEQRAKMMEAVGQDPLKLDLFLKRLHGFDDNFDKAGLNRDFSDGSGQNRRLRHADEVAGINGMEWADVNVLGKADGNGNEMYDGNPLVNLKAFFRKLRLFLMQFPFAPTPEQAVAHLVGRLRGRALIAYQAMPPNVQADFDLIEAALKQKFPNDEFVWASEMELQSCYQGPHESVHAFSQRVAELVYAVLDGMPEEEVERNLRREMMYRLREELREYVQEKDPETYEEVLQYARRGEANLQRRKQKYHERFSRGHGVYVVEYRRSVNYDPESHPRAWECPPKKGFRRSYSKNFGPRRCYVCDAPDHLARNCPWAYERENDGQDWNHGGDQQDVYGGKDWNHERRSCGKSVIDPRRCFICDEQGHLARECPYQAQVGNGDVLEEYPQLAGVTGDYGTGQDEAFYGPSDSSGLYSHVYMNTVQLAGYADYGIPDNLQPRRVEANVLESLGEGGILVTATIDGGEADDQVAAEETVMRYKGLHGSAVSGSHFGGNKGPEFAFGRPDVHQMAEAEVVDELYASPLVKNFSRKVEGKTGHKVHDPGGLSLEGSSCMKSTWSNVVAVNRSFGSFYNIAESMTPSPSTPTGAYCLLRLSTPSSDGTGFIHQITPIDSERLHQQVKMMALSDRIESRIIQNDIINPTTSIQNITNIYLNMDDFRRINPYNSNQMYPEVSEIPETLKPKKPEIKKVFELPEFPETHENDIEEEEDYGYGEGYAEDNIGRFATYPPIPLKSANALKRQQQICNENSRIYVPQQNSQNFYAHPPSAPVPQFRHPDATVHHPTVRSRRENNYDSEIERLKQKEKQLQERIRQIEIENQKAAQQIEIPPLPPRRKRRVKFRTIKEAFQFRAQKMALPFKKRFGNLRLSDYDESVLASEYTSLNSQSFDGSISTSAESSSASDASSQDSGVHDDLFVFPEAPENSLHWTNRLFRKEKKLHLSREQFIQLSEYLEEQPWFHGTIHRMLAESRLVKNGEFLLRQSTFQPGQFILSVLRNRTPHHICLVNQEGQIRSHAGEFTSVMHLIQFHFTTSTPICSKSSAVLLRIPVPRPKFIQKVTY